jgi:hypothetical protein
MDFLEIIYRNTNVNVIIILMIYKIHSIRQSTSIKRLINNINSLCYHCINRIDSKENFEKVCFDK